MTLSASNIRREILEVHALISVSPYIAIDTEGTGIEGIRDGRDFTYGVSVAGRDSTKPDWPMWSRYLPFKHIEEDQNLTPDEAKLIFSAFSARTKTKPAIFHNRKYDQFALRTLGYDFDGYWFDTAMMIKMVNENWHAGLDWFSKNIMKREGKRKSEEYMFFVNMYGGEPLHWKNGHKFPVRAMGDYSTGDTEETVYAFEYLWPLFQKEGYWS